MTSLKVARASAPRKAPAPSALQQYQSWAVTKILAAVHQVEALDRIEVCTVDRATADQWRADAQAAIAALGRFVERLPRSRP